VLVALLPLSSGCVPRYGKRRGQKANRWHPDNQNQ
jgi:hypothetical protein